MKNDNWLKENWFKLIIAISILTVGVSLSYYLLSTKSNQKIVDIKSAIQKSIPSDSLLREYKKIPDSKRESYLGIYVVNYNINKLQEKTDDNWYYSSCPEETMGQSACGVYHLFLFQNGEIVNDVIIPKDPDAEIYSGEEGLCLSFNNTKQNNASYFGGEIPSDSNKFDIEKTSLINFGDYTGDGLRQEFIITGLNLVCGHVNKLVAGYDESINRVVIYGIKTEKEVGNWYDNLNPDSTGSVVTKWLCGDHGSDTETIKKFTFDKKSNNYVLIENTKRKCFDVGN